MPGVQPGEHPSTELEDEIIGCGGCSSKTRFHQMWPAGLIEQVDAAYAQTDFENDIPSMAMATAFARSQNWENILRFGLCTPGYVLDQANTQLNNIAVISVLLAGFSLSFVFAVPDFVDDDGEAVSRNNYWFRLYGVSTALAGLLCLIGTLVTSVALGAINNVLPTRSAMIFISARIFKPVRTIAEICIILGVAALLLGLLAALRLHFGEALMLYFIIPIAFCFVVFILAYVQFKLWMCEGDLLVAADLLRAAKTRTSIHQGLTYSS